MRMNNRKAAIGIAGKIIIMLLSVFVVWMITSSFSFSAGNTFNENLLFSTCDYDNDDLLIDDTCHCVHVDDSRGKGFVIINPSFELPKDKNDPFYLFVNYDQREFFTQSKMLAEKDAKEIITYIETKGVDQIEFTNFPSLYLNDRFDAAMKDKQRALNIFCPTASSWEQCSASTVRDNWFVTLNTDTGLEYATTCFIPENECLNIMGRDKQKCSKS